MTKRIFAALTLVLLLAAPAEARHLRMQGKTPQTPIPPDPTAVYVTVGSATPSDLDNGVSWPPTDPATEGFTQQGLSTQAGYNTYVTGGWGSGQFDTFRVGEKNICVLAAKPPTVADNNAGYWNGVAEVALSVNHGPWAIQTKMDVDPEHPTNPYCYNFRLKSDTATSGVSKHLEARAILVPRVGKPTVLQGNITTKDVWATKADSSYAYVNYSPGSWSLFLNIDPQNKFPQLTLWKAPKGSGSDAGDCTDQNNPCNTWEHVIASAKSLMNSAYGTTDDGVNNFHATDDLGGLVVNLTNGTNHDCCWSTAPTSGSILKAKYQWIHVQANPTATAPFGADPRGDPSGTASDGSVKFTVKDTSSNFAAEKVWWSGFSKSIGISSQIRLSASLSSTTWSASRISNVFHRGDCVNLADCNGHEGWYGYDQYFNEDYDNYVYGANPAMRQETLSINTTVRELGQNSDVMDNPKVIIGLHGSCSHSANAANNNHLDFMQWSHPGGMNYWADININVATSGGTSSYANCWGDTNLDAQGIFVNSIPTWNTAVINSTTQTLGSAWGMSFSDAQNLFVYHPITGKSSFDVYQRNYQLVTDGLYDPNDANFWVRDGSGNPLRSAQFSTLSTFQDSAVVLGATSSFPALKSGSWPGLRVVYDGDASEPDTNDPGDSPTTTRLGRFGFSAELDTAWPHTVWIDRSVTPNIYTDLRDTRFSIYALPESQTSFTADVSGSSMFTATASMSGTILTVTSTPTNGGNIQFGYGVSGDSSHGKPTNVIVSQKTSTEADGHLGGKGTYQMAWSYTVGSQTMTFDRALMNVTAMTSGTIWCAMNSDGSNTTGLPFSNSGAWVGAGGVGGRVSACLTGTGGTGTYYLGVIGVSGQGAPIGNGTNLAFSGKVNDAYGMFSFDMQSSVYAVKSINGPPTYSKTALNGTPGLIFTTAGSTGGTWGNTGQVIGHSGLDYYNDGKFNGFGSNNTAAGAGGDAGTIAGNSPYEIILAISQDELPSTMAATRWIWGAGTALDYRRITVSKGTTGKVHICGTYNGSSGTTTGPNYPSCAPDGASSDTVNGVKGPVVIDVFYDGGNANGQPGHICTGVFTPGGPSDFTIPAYSPTPNTRVPGTNYECNTIAAGDTSQLGSISGTQTLFGSPLNNSKGTNGAYITMKLGKFLQVRRVLTDSERQAEVRAAATRIGFTIP
jgi:hypothetical protein